MFADGVPRLGRTALRSFPQPVPPQSRAKNSFIVPQRGVDFFREAAATGTTESGADSGFASGSRSSVVTATTSKMG